MKGKMSNKKLAFGTALIMFSFITLIAFLVTFYTPLQAINPIGAITAIFVAVIGITWFKKSNN